MKDFNELVAEYGFHIPYYQLLTCKEWRSKRQLIINRDKKKCQICNKEGFDDYQPKLIYRKGGVPDIIFVPVNYEIKEVFIKQYIEDLGIEIEVPSIEEVQHQVESPIYLHVHHKYYILTRYPWDYNDSALITVCSDCHKKIHESQNIPVFKDESLTENLKYTPCTRCSGQGVLPQYWHVSNGVCFRCGGAKYDELIRDFDRFVSE